MAYDPKTFDWWNDARAGKKVPYHSDQAMQGYYAYKPSDKAAPRPVALWYNKEGELLCKVDNQPYRNGLDMWVMVMRNPIDFEVYKAVVAGDAWPNELRFEKPDGTTDSTMVATQGHNQGDDIFTSLTGNIDEWVDRANAIKKKGAPETKDEADVAADVATKLAELCQQAEDAGMAERQPHLEAQRAIKAKWDKHTVPGRSAARDCKLLVDLWQKKENARRREEAVKLQEQAKASGQDSITVVADEVRAGTRGKAITTVKTTVVIIEDLAACMGFIAKLDVPPPDVVKAVETATLRLLKAGIAVPGAKLDKKESVR